MLKSNKVYRLQSGLCFDCRLCFSESDFTASRKEPFNSVFNAINESNAIVVSVDIPSGTDASDGSVIHAVRADLTVAISAYKYCHILPPANAYCGKITAVNIGILMIIYSRKRFNHNQNLCKKYI